MKTLKKSLSKRKKIYDTDYILNNYPGDWINKSKNYYMKGNKLYADLKRKDGDWRKTSIKKNNDIGMYSNINGHFNFINNQKDKIKEISNKFDTIINSNIDFNNIPIDIREDILKLEKYVDKIYNYIDNYIDNQSMEQDIIVIDSQKDLDKLINNNLFNHINSKTNNKIDSVIETAGHS